MPNTEDNEFLQLVTGTYVANGTCSVDWEEYVESIEKVVPIADDEDVVERARAMMLRNEQGDVDECLRLANHAKQKEAYDLKTENAKAALARLKNGQNPSVQCKFTLKKSSSELVRMCPLVIASRFKNLQMLKVIVDFDRDQSNRSEALVEASKHGHHESVEILLRSASRWYSEVNQFEDNEIVEPPSSSSDPLKGLEPHVLGFCLFTACLNGYDEVARRILNHCPNPWCGIVGGSLYPVFCTGNSIIGNALFAAIEHKHIECVKVLVEKQDIVTADIYRALKMMLRVRSCDMMVILLRKYPAVYSNLDLLDLGQTEEVNSLKRVVRYMYEMG